MAKCDLSIELDDPQRVYDSGDTITGTVHVLADADVKCKGLEVATNWRTHGRGNVAQGNAETITVFSGEWVAGQRESYRFELRVPFWPPSYHGSYINIDHYIDARAKIPWAFDPKASQEYVMRPTTALDADALNIDTAQTSGCVAWAIGAIFVLIFGGVCLFLAVNPFVWIMVGLIGLPIGAFAAARYWLPKYYLGNVESQLVSEQVAPGGVIQARLSMQPRRGTTINAITATLSGAEVCISGSGSNKTTHRNQFFEDKKILEGETVLQAGVRKEFDLEFAVPDDVPYSFDLDDNDLNWQVELRVDIPRWPDWTRTLKIQVVPGGSDSKAIESAASTQTPTSQPTEPSGDITFAETAAHLWELRAGDDEQIDMLVGAVTGMTFDMDTYIERRLLYSGDEDPHVYEDGFAVWAHHSEPPLPLVLYVPHDLGDEFEQAGRDLWRCRGTIVGWDHAHGRLQIKVLP